MQAAPARLAERSEVVVELFQRKPVAAASERFEEDPDGPQLLAQPPHVGVGGAGGAPGRAVAFVVDTAALPGSLLVGRQRGGLAERAS